MPNTVQSDAHRVADHIIDMQPLAREAVRRIVPSDASISPGSVDEMTRLRDLRRLASKLRIELPPTAEQSQQNAQLDAMFEDILAFARQASANERGGAEARAAKNKSVVRSRIESALREGFPDKTDSHSETADVICTAMRRMLAILAESEACIDIRNHLRGDRYDIKWLIARLSDVNKRLAGKSAETGPVGNSEHGPVGISENTPPGPVGILEEISPKSPVGNSTNSTHSIQAKKAQSRVRASVASQPQIHAGKTVGPVNRDTLQLIGIPSTHYLAHHLNTSPQHPERRSSQSKNAPSPETVT